MDRVRFTPLERAELNDLNGLQDLNQEHMRRLLGQLLGAGDLTSRAKGGVLADPSLSYTHATGLLSLQSFSFLSLTAGGATLNNGDIATPEARIVRFNSSDTEHINSPIDVSAHRTIGTEYTAYGRWIRVDTNLEARRKWDTSLNSEVSFTQNTRESERVEFLVSSSLPVDSTDTDKGKWTPLFKYTVFQVNTNYTLTYTLIHAFDEFNASITDRITLDSVDHIDTSLKVPQGTGHSENSKTLGLGQVVSMLKAQVFKLLSDGTNDSGSPGSTTRWTDAPVLSMRGVLTRLQGVESTALQHTTDITDTNVRIDNINVYDYSFLIYGRINTSNVSEFLVSQRTTNPDNPTITVGFDYYRYNLINSPATPFPDMYNGTFTTIGQHQQVFSNIYISFPESFDGKKILNLNCYPVEILNGTSLEDNNGPRAFTYSFNSVNGLDLLTTTGNEDFLEIRENRYTNTNNQNVNFYGPIVRLNMDPITSPNSLYNREYVIKIDMRVSAT